MKRFLRWVCIAGLVMVVPIAAHANPVLHMVMAELSGCQDYDEVGKVVKEISVEAGFKGTAWMPLHHNGGAGHVGLVILAPSLIDYGKQMDGFIALMNGKDSDVYRKLTSCVRVVRRSADEILAGPSTVADDIRVAERSTWRLKDGCSGDDVVKQLETGNKWMRERGYLERGVRKPLFGADDNTIITYGLHPSFEAATEMFSAFREEVAKPGSELAQLWATVHECRTLVSRGSAVRID